MAVRTQSNEPEHYSAVGILQHLGGDGRLALTVYECPTCLALTRSPDGHRPRCRDYGVPDVGTGLTAAAALTC